MPISKGFQNIKMPPKIMHLFHQSSHVHKKNTCTHVRPITPNRL